jgi:hypothetical protein
MTRRLAFVVTVALAVFSTSLGAAESGHKPKPHGISYYYDAFDQSVVRPVTRFFDPALLVRRIGGRRIEAPNVDQNDQVLLPTTWWQPRLGYHPVSIEQMLRGPGPGTGPAAGPWRVVRAKTQGVSKGFQIVDSGKTRFAIKFDPPRFLEMATGADVVVSKLYWAAGYNVPDNSIVVFKRSDLVVDAKASITNAAGKKIPMTEAFLDQLLEGVPRYPDGTYRAVASRFLSGEPLGEWEYHGLRDDEPEDRVPHEHRREIRGLWAINAWLNHTDCSARNTIDMWVTDGGRSFVRHHLIDFSGCLGSGSIDKQSPRNGHDNLFDYGAIAVALSTLGLHRPGWEDAEDPNLPSVGFIDSKTFEPATWKPFLPNPAFDERTDRDVAWGVHVVEAFTDDHIRAAVAQGKYRDPRAEEYLVRILIERRDKLVRELLHEASAAEAR